MRLQQLPRERRELQPKRTARLARSACILLHQKMVDYPKDLCNIQNTITVTAGDALTMHLKPMLRLSRTGSPSKRLSWTSSQLIVKASILGKLGVCVRGSTFVQVRSRDSNEGEARFTSGTSYTWRDHHVHPWCLAHYCQCPIMPVHQPKYWACARR